MKAYIEISVEKELPEFDGLYHCIVEIPQECGNTWTVKSTIGVGNNQWLIDNESKMKVTHWNKPFSLPELMEEAIRCYNEGFRVLKGVSMEHEMPSEKDFVNDFLTQKGIIEESGPDWDALNDFPNKAF